MRVLERLAEHFSSTWKLLSETNRFLSKTSLSSHYEAEFTDMRSRLKSHRSDRDTISEIKDRLIQVRKSLRLSGYDLSLVDHDLVVSGYRDDSSADSYKRLVIFIGGRGIWSLSGDANHQTLYEYLAAEPHGDIEQRHYLWYRWEGRTALLSGADSEDPADFEALKTWCELPENRHLLLRHMKERHR